MTRKAKMLERMSKEAGRPITGKTLGVILSPDGKQGDVFMFDGFHLRLGWSQHATDDYYLGTYQIGED